MRDHLINVWHGHSCYEVRFLEVESGALSARSVRNLSTNAVVWHATVKPTMSPKVVQIMRRARERATVIRVEG